MKNNIFSLILLLLVLPSVYAKNDVVIISLSYTEDTKTTYSISREHAQKLPEWNPTDQKSAPLSTADAIKAAQTWLKQKYPDSGVSQVETVCLCKLNSRLSSAPENRWYYKIQFSLKLDGKFILDNDFFAIVLFDGSIVEPVKTKGSMFDEYK
jgi:hypothetical protein